MGRTERAFALGREPPASKDQGALEAKRRPCREAGKSVPQLEGCYPQLQRAQKWNLAPSLPLVLAL